MTEQEAWDIIQDNVGDDCGPYDEGWKSDELLEAMDVFHRLYSPRLTSKALFPDNPYMWPLVERPAP